MFGFRLFRNSGNSLVLVKIMKEKKKFQQTHCLAVIQAMKALLPDNELQNARVPIGFLAQEFAGG